MLNHLLHGREPEIDVTYRQAVISFCAELTSPVGTSMPVGVLLVAKTQDAYYAATSVWEQHEGTHDPVTQAFLGDLPDLLQRHARKAFASVEPNPSLEGILNSLHDSLRASLHVAKITDQVAETIRVKDMHGVLINRAMETLIRETKVDPEQVFLSPSRPPRPRFGHAPTPPSRRFTAQPESQTWTLAACQ